MLWKRRIAAIIAVTLMAAAALLVTGVGRNAALAQVTCPTTLPPAGNFTSAGTTQGQFKSNLTNLVAYLTCLLGSDGTSATAKSTLGLATVATSGSYTDLSNKPAIITGPGSTTNNFIPQWNGTGGSALSAGVGTGTGANNLVQLDGSARLPAVDASQLTNFAQAETAYSVNGTYTYTPATGITNVWVGCVGAGGGGGGASGASTKTQSPGGGAGGWSEGIVSVTPGIGVTVTIGQGGAGGSSAPTGGSAGGDSSFGTSIVAKGGGGGSAPSQFGSGGGVGGLASAGTGTFKTDGGSGNDAISNTGTGILSAQGIGGASHFGGGARVTSGGQSATVPGAGGGGVYSTTGTSGGAGADGACIVISIR